MSAGSSSNFTSAANATRRRPDTNMDYYLARQEKKKRVKVLARF